jgi:acyl-CoA thioesterase-1
MRFKALIAALCLSPGEPDPPPLPASADEIKIVGFGDSLMAAYNLEADEGFPARLAGSPARPRP